MISYENYVKIRISKNMKDSDVAKKSNIPPSTFTDWKKGKSTPKMEKMQKIADALGVDYFELTGPVGKFSEYNPNKPKIENDYEILSKEERNLIDLFRNAEESYRQDVLDLLEKHQKKECGSKSLKEA